MLNNYLEKKIRNKIFIVKSLYSSEQYSVLEFSNLLSISQSTVYNYFFEITQILGKKVEIVDKSPCMKLDNLEQDLHKIYNTSEFLLLLKYFLKNTSEDSIANFIEDNDISRAKFYMIRKNVVEYLNNIGLNIYKNKIIGNELKKKLLLAKIEVVYGISIISFAIKKRYEKSIEQFLGNISDPYITKYNQKMFKFVLLQIIYDDSELFDCEVEIYKEFFCVPRFIKKQIHLFVIQHFTKNKIEQKENKITFLFCFFCTGVFFLKDKKKLEQQMLINRLFYLFEQYFGEKVTKSSLFEYLILDCIKYIYFDCFEFLVEEKNLLAYNSQIYKKVLKIISSIQIDFLFNSSVLHFFCVKLEQILVQVSQTKLYIFSDSYLEYLDIYSELSKNLHVDVTLIDVWVYSRKQLSLLDGINNLIVTNVNNVDYLHLVSSENFIFIKIPLDKIELRILNEKILECLNTKV